MLDRLVGYKASPVLWKTVKKGISAGRVQTVALRLIVEREREIRAFKPVEYWTIEALLEKDGQQFTAKLHHIDGKKAEIRNEAEARARFSTISKARKTFDVTEVKRRERRKNPSAPFTTRTLQQEAAKKLAFGSKRTMRVAQDLYEGIEIGDEGAVGLITYMRTDSTRVAESAAQQARDYLRDAVRRGVRRHDAAALRRRQSRRTRRTRTKRIRPTDPTRRPDDDQAVSERRPVQALPADLAALHGVADGAGRVRHDDGRLRHSVDDAAGHRPSQLPVPRDRQRS